MSDMTAATVMLAALVLPMFIMFTDGRGVKHPKIKTNASPQPYDTTWNYDDDSQCESGGSVSRYKATYGEEFILDCSSHDTTNSIDLTIQSDAKCIQTKRINATTIRATLKPNLGKYLYSCVDGSCEDSLWVDVEPAISVTAPGVRYEDTDKIYRQRTYFVPRGELYNVFCSSNKPKSLELRSSYGSLRTDIINETTVMYHTQADDTEYREYRCFSDSDNKQVTTVMADFPPVAEEFKCVLHQRQKLECSWQSNSEQNTFKLFNKDLKMLCADDSGERMVTCKWFNRYEGKPLLNADESCTLILQTCNKIYCSNQTFDFYCNSITKLDTVLDFKMVNTSSRGAFLSWNIPLAPRYRWRRFPMWENFIYKIEYRLRVFGEKWRSANTSTVVCDYDICEYLLTLPYPESIYKARIYIKFIEAVEDRFWSKPAYINTISTGPREECACTLQEPPASTTPTEASCQVCELTESTIKESMALSKHKINLKQKLDKIKRYTKVLDNLDSVRNTVV